MNTTGATLPTKNFNHLRNNPIPRTMLTQIILVYTLLYFYGAYTFYKTFQSVVNNDTEFEVNKLPEADWLRNISQSGFLNTVFNYPVIVMLVFVCSFLVLPVIGGFTAIHRVFILLFFHPKQ